LMVELPPRPRPRQNSVASWCSVRRAVSWGYWNASNF
jgi:hypothetical protein